MEQVNGSIDTICQAIEIVVLKITQPLPFARRIARSGMRNPAAAHVASPYLVPATTHARSRGQFSPLVAHEEAAVGPVLKRKWWNDNKTVKAMVSIDFDIVVIIWLKKKILECKSCYNVVPLSLQ